MQNTRVLHLLIFRNNRQSNAKPPKNLVNLVNLENNPVKRVFLYIIANNYTGAVSSKWHKYGGCHASI